MNLKIRYIIRQPQVLERLREVELTESELQIVLDRIGPSEFDQNPTARGLMDYLAGRGEFATYVDLADRHEEVKLLLHRVSREAHFTQPETPVVEHWIGEEGDEDRFYAHDARPVT